MHMAQDGHHPSVSTDSPRPPRGPKVHATRGPLPERRPAPPTPAARYHRRPFQHARLASSANTPAGHPRLSGWAGPRQKPTASRKRQSTLCLATSASAPCSRAARRTHLKQKRPSEPNRREARMMAGPPPNWWPRSGRGRRRGSRPRINSATSTSSKAAGRPAAWCAGHSRGRGGNRPRKRGARRVPRSNVMAVPQQGQAVIAPASRPAKPAATRRPSVSLRCAPASSRAGGAEIDAPNGRVLAASPGPSFFSAAFVRKPSDILPHHPNQPAQAQPRERNGQTQQKQTPRAPRTAPRHTQLTKED